MKIHTECIDLNKYTANEPERLADLGDGLFHLAMRRTSGSGAEALLAPVYVKLIESELARTAFTVTFTDKDLNPAHTKGLNSQLIEGYWKPARAMRLRGKHVNGKTNTGYFMPYSDELDLDLLLNSVALENDIYV